MRKLASKIINRYPPIYLARQIFRNRTGAMKGTLAELHDEFRIDAPGGARALDLGCGFSPKNMFEAEALYGVDRYEDKERNIFEVNLGFEKLPFDDSSFHYVTAYDVLEHIPKFAESSESRGAPFIYLMNEVFRVLRPGGRFFTLTPIFPYLGAFQDPTHNNIITADTFELYFSKDKLDIAKHYGITAEFDIIYKKMSGDHLVAILQK